MIIQKEIRNLIKELAGKYSLTSEEAKDCVFSQFKYVREELSKGEKGGDISSFKNIILKYLGTFFTRERRLKRITEAKKKKDARLDKDFQHQRELLGELPTVQDSESI